MLLTGTWNGKALRRLKVSAYTESQFTTLSGIPGFSPKTNEFPPEPFTYRLLLQLFQSSQLFRLDPKLEAWYAEWQDSVELSNYLHHRQDVELGDPIEERLYPYQRVGATWLAVTQTGILADEVGLGKTVQALAAAKLLGAVDILVVTLNLAKTSVWERHIKDWLGKYATVCDGTHAQRQAQLDRISDVVVINHEMLRPKLGYKNLLNRPWDVVIIDEAHKFQGRNSAMSEGAELLKTKRMFLLTGTPIWSNPDSLWHLLKLLQPERFSSYWRFIAEYFQTQQTPWTTEILGVRPEKQELLEELIAPLLLRRTKAEVLTQLPPKVRLTIEYRHHPSVLTALRTLKRKRVLLRRDGSVVKYYDSAAATLADMRQLLNTPNRYGYLDDPKSGVISDLLGTIPGKVVIFTWHAEYAFYLSQMLDPSYTNVLITGNTSQAHREKCLAEFANNPDCKVLVGTIGAMGTAINDLIVASVAIFAEGAYIPALNEQAEGRLHRNGQKTDVTIYRLVAPGTIEEAIWKVSDTRADIADELTATKALEHLVFGDSDDNLE